MSLNPSKSPLIFIYALVNKQRIKILIDTGASKTFINNKILHHLVPITSILEQPSSFLLADGIASFKVLGLVNLSIEFNSFVTPITAFIAQHLCTDMIIGMDYINKYNLNINVQKQIVTVQAHNHHVVVPIVNQTKSIKIPVISSNTVLVSFNSVRKIPVTIPISCISLPFIPASSFKLNVLFDNKMKHLSFKNYCSDLTLNNTMRIPKVIEKGTCLGYLLCCSTFQHPRTFYSSHHHVFGASKCSRVPSTSSDLRLNSDPSNRSSDLRNINKNTTSTTSISSSLLDTVLPSIEVDNPIVTQHLSNLVQNIQDDHHKQDLFSLLMRFSNIFDITRHNIARTSIPHVINTVPHSPPASRAYPQPNTEEQMYDLIQEFLKAGLISESHSPYAAPAMLVKKKDNSFRLVVDYKKLNAITIKDSSPLPNMEDTIFKLGKGFSYFSKLDLKSGFYQIPINQNDKEKTAFITPFGLYRFNVLPMGLRNSPPTFQKVMSDTLKSCRSFSLVYLDDIIVFSKSFVHHLIHLAHVFSALQEMNLVINPLKCELAVQKIDYLSHTISKNLIQPMSDKIEAILQIKELRTLAQANRFLGSLGWYRKFLPKFAEVAAPIHSVTNLTKSNRRNFKWGITQSKAFHQLKKMLTIEPLFLHFPVDDLPVILTTDASDVGIGGVLQQIVNGQGRNLYYHSQLITPCQRKYSTIEKEALAIYKCLDRMRSFVLGRNIIIMTDHFPLCYIMHKSIKNKRVNRITHLIQEYNIDKIVHIRGQYNCLPDYLSRYDKEQPDDLFDIEYGLASKNHSALSSTTPSDVTDNLTLDVLVSFANPNVLAAMTLRPRKYRVDYSEKSISGHSDVKTLHDDLDISVLRHRRKSRVTSKISQNYFDIAKLQGEQDRDPEIQNIIKHLSNSSSLSSFILENSTLYKLISCPNSSNRTIKVLYLPSSMVNSLLKAYHDDPLTGAHFSTDRMYYKIRPHFWWPRMKTTIQRYVKSIPPPEGPFNLIGIDFCGPLPRTPRENQYVLVITDYFTRHITAIALPNCTAETTARALFDDFFSKFGIPSAILSDRGTHFQNKLMENMQNLIGYNHIYSTPYHPQTNGVVERFNATFVAQISKLQNTQHNNWDEYLQTVVFAYNTGVHKSTRFSPYELLYGRAARLPIHITPREFTFLKPNDYFEQLKRTLRIFHQASRENIILQQQANQTYYNKNRLDPQLKLGDKVFTRVFISKGKLDPKFSPIPKTVVEIHHPMYIVEDECTQIRSQVHISDLRPISFA
ncbi:unnamed protein product [Rotaria magnacalcarata]|uniref:RNA-directed DNA polymerase n=1 Tax=Rotaria magnacalcarata TaxID=392030 RepID=A0A820BHK4_9BILA|nr:unnamed protein product [Rotaria magnacalcarata]CAF4199022.1 unnamed protein product [Rotaria magnacalcarata]